MLTGDGPRRRGAGLRRGPGRPAQAGREDEADAVGGRRVVDVQGRAARLRSRRWRSRSTSRRPSSTASSRATCAGPRPRCCRASRSAASSRSRRCSTSWSGVTPETRNSLTSIQQLLIDKPGRRSRPPRRRGRRPHCSQRRASSSARPSRATSTSSAAISGRESRRRGARRRGPARRTLPSRSSTTPSCSVSGETQPRRLADLVGIAARSGSSCCCRPSRQLAPGDAVLPDASRSPGGRRAGGAASGRQPVVRLVSGLLAVFGLAVRNGLLLVDRFRGSSGPDGEDLEAGPRAALHATACRRRC